MRIAPDQLKLVNPSCEYYPPGFDQAAWKKFRENAMEFARQLAVEFAAPFQVSGEDLIQDSTHGAEIYLPDHLTIGEGKVISSIRVSNHQNLYVITVVRRVSQETETRFEQVAENAGFTYTPEGLFGEPFDTRARTNGDLFNQLYDYV